MKHLRRSSLQEYAEHFWQHENRKGQRAAKSGHFGNAAVDLMKSECNYKLPLPHFDAMHLVEIETPQELNEVVMRPSTVADEWTKQRGLAPSDGTLDLGGLTKLAMARRYFDEQLGDSQIYLFRKWQGRGNLAGVLVGDPPLLQEIRTGVFEIVDGWGRLHAMAALVFHGLPFQPFECFVAAPSSSETF